jgi:hypothetical protein
VTTASLTPDELEALHLTAALSSVIKRIIESNEEMTGQEPDAGVAYQDWDEVVVVVHHLQHLIMAQAAARAYPEQFRLLGHRLT